MDIVRPPGLNVYCFSLERVRIEPPESESSAAVLNHYQTMVAGRRKRGPAPMVMFNDFTAPRWVVVKGG